MNSRKLQKHLLHGSLLLSTLVFVFSCADKKEEQKEAAAIQCKKWDKVELSFQGPETNERADKNPFLDYILEVEFTNKEHTLLVEGFYAADGKAAETSADSGAVWKVRFRPYEAGTWTYNAKLLEGKDIAVENDRSQAKEISLKAHQGTIEVTSAEASEKGRLTTKGRYFKYTDSDRYFLKHGAGSPENLLAYADFDATFRQKAKDRKGESKANDSIHYYAPHLKDWNEGDPTWQNEKGKAIIGGINYLASKGLNSIYFLTLNIQGDGEDVWPYSSYSERTRFDCSKLDQWEILFDHIDSKDMLLHFITQETENELLLNNGDTGLERKLYYRELIARFGHHRKVVWNMGEENGWAKFTPQAQTDDQRKAMFDYFKENDPYLNPVVLHSHHYKPERDSVFNPLLGYKNLDGISAQVSFPHQVHEVTKEWIGLSEASGKPWVLSVDEIGPAERGIDPDDRPDNNQHDMRKQNIWGHFMAGGTGVEWYFGYKNHNTDLGMEDWRSRDAFWKYGTIAVRFFQDHLPFSAMQSHDELIGTKGGYCFTDQDKIYAVYLPNGGSTTLKTTTAGNYSLQWFNPRTGGELLEGKTITLAENEILKTGTPPTEPNEDWTILIKKVN